MSCDFLPFTVYFTSVDNELVYIRSGIFNYFGVTITKNGKFKLAKQKNIEKATKAMYEVIRRGKKT